MKREVCKLAKKMADEHGGRPADYMKDAWEIVKDSVGYQEPRKRKTNSKGKGAEKMSMLGWAVKTAGVYVGKKVLEGGKRGVKSGVKRGANDLNFLKSPKDRPTDVMPDSLKDYFKNTFR